MNYDNFVGGYSTTSATLQDVQTAINWFVELDGDPGAKTPKALLGTPGLQDLGQNIGASGEVRGMWVVSGSQLAVLVIGTSVIFMRLNVATSTATNPMFTYTPVGSLRTTTGRVGIRDNGRGNVIAIVDGPNLYTYNLATLTFNTVSDPAFLGSNVICEIDGWFIFAQPNTQTFYTSPLYWDGTAPFDATYFALKDDSHDNINAMIEVNRELWLIGEETTEVWYMQGGSTFPLGRLQGAMRQLGATSQFPLAKHSTGLIWLGRSERGNGEVILVNGYQPTVVSTPAISKLINSVPGAYNATGYVYTEEGHTFYVLALPQANLTLVYDLTTGLWHQRASYDPVAGVFNRHRVAMTINFQGIIVAGDIANGKIYWQSRQFYTEDIYPLVSVRQAPHMWDKDDRARVRYTRLQLEFKPGSAPETGIYTNPQAILSWSNDGGQSWGDDHFAPIGRAGVTTNRVIWRRLGMARDRVFKVTVSDPVNRDIVGASINGDILKT